MQKINIKGNSIFLIESFFTEDECNKMILLSEQRGYEQAQVISNGKSITDLETRNNSRLFYDDKNLAKELMDRAKEFIPENPARFNEWFRFYKYKVGQKFRIHKDMPYITNEEISKYTFMIYLNDNFEGGKTNFYTDDDYGFLFKSIKPARGTALVFKHWEVHEGGLIEQGEKYVLRTDVMFNR